MAYVGPSVTVSDNRRKNHDGRSCKSESSAKRRVAGVYAESHPIQPELLQRTIAVLSRLSELDAKILSEMLAAPDGRRELREWLGGFCRLSPGAREAVIDRLMNEPALRVRPRDESA